MDVIRALETLFYGLTGRISTALAGADEDLDPGDPFLARLEVAAPPPVLPVQTSQAA